MATEGVRTRFPCGPNAGELADRYSSHDKIPLFRRVGFNAIQCGGAGYWYVDADLSAKLRDAVDVATGETVKQIDNIRQSAEDFVGGTGKYLILAGLAYVALQFIGRRK